MYPILFAVGIFQWPANAPFFGYLERRIRRVFALSVVLRGFGLLLNLKVAPDDFCFNREPPLNAAWEDFGGIFNNCRVERHSFGFRVLVCLLRFLEYTFFLSFYVSEHFVLSVNGQLFFSSLISFLSLAMLIMEGLKSTVMTEPIKSVIIYCYRTFCIIF